MWQEPVRRPFRLALIGSLAECQRLGLGEHIGEQHVMMPAQWVPRPRECDEIAGNKSGALMDQLIKGVLPICAGLAPINRTRLAVDRRAGERDVLAVALHRQLLQISWEALEILVVGKDCNGL